MITFIENFKKKKEKKQRIICWRALVSKQILNIFITLVCSILTKCPMKEQNGVIIKENLSISWDV